MRTFAKILGVVVALFAVALLSFAMGAKRSELPARQGTLPAFSPQQLASGARLAAVGGCAGCHTSPGGAPYAGGLAIGTPFGTFYSTNITPDSETGIGAWTLDAFTRALREGIARNGDYLYPAFPFDHFTRLRDDDVAALYAHLMTRAPVAATPPRTRLAFPYNIRLLLAGWKILFFERGRYDPNPAQSAEWNRGAYLVEALAHCGSCHTPRNAFGAERRAQRYDGAVNEGWWAPALNASSPALTPWTRDGLVAYLRGFDANHGGALGPMAEVSESLARLDEADLQAIATYMAGLATGAKDRSGELAQIETRSFDAGGDAALRNGEQIYKGACASCHDSGGRVAFTTASLARHSALQAPEPHNAITTILRGIAPPDGEPGAGMPGFGALLDDRNVADLLAYLRKRFSDAPPWPDTSATIAAARHEAQPRSAVMR